MSVVGPVVGPVVIGVVSGIIATEGAGNPVKPPLLFTAEWSPNEVVLTWTDNSGNANVATGYTISRAGQPDVPIAAGTLTYTDTRDITPGETIVWTITLTTIDGTSGPAAASETIPVVVSLRIDSDGNTRITADGDRRIIEEVA